MIWFLGIGRYPRSPQPPWACLVARACYPFAGTGFVSCAAAEALSSRQLCPCGWLELQAARLNGCHGHGLALVVEYTGRSAKPRDTTDATKNNWDGGGFDFQMLLWKNVKDLQVEFSAAFSAAVGCDIRNQEMSGDWHLQSEHDMGHIQDIFFMPWRILQYPAA